MVSINCGIEPPTTFRLTVLKLWVHLYNKLYLLVSAVDPQGSGVKCYISPPDVTIHTGRMTVHTQLNVAVWWLIQVRRSKGGGWEALHPPAKMLGGASPIPHRWRPCMRTRFNSSRHLGTDLFWRDKIFGRKPLMQAYTAKRITVY